MRSALLLFGAFVLASTAARADEPPPASPPSPPHLGFELTYTLSPGIKRCPARMTVEHTLIGYLGYDPFRRKPDVHVTINITRRNGGFHAELNITLADGKVFWVEEMDEPVDCLDLVRALTLVVAARTDPLQPSELAPAPPPSPPPPPTPSPASPPPASPAAPPAAAPNPRVPPRAPPTPPSPWSVRVGAGPEVSFGGLVPGVGLGGAGLIGVQWNTLSLAVEPRAITSVAPAHEQGFLIRGSLLGGALVPCWHRGAIALCLPFHLGLLTTWTGSIQAIPEPKLPFLFGIGGRLEAERPIGHNTYISGFGDFSVVARRPTRGFLYSSTANATLPQAALGVLFALRIGVKL